MENRYLSENFDRIPESLSVVSFSIDKNEEAWRSASEIDKIVWTNVSDLSGDKGKVKTQYEVQGIPMSYLIDDKGVVIERFGGFSPDEDLTEKLQLAIEKHQNS